MKVKGLNWRIALAAVPLTLIGAIGCGGGGADDEEFFYRITNAIPFLISGIDFWVDKEVQTTAMAYGSSTDYEMTDIEKRDIFFDILDNSTSEFLDSIVYEKQDEQSVHLFALGIKDGPANLQPIARLSPVVVNRLRPQGNARLVFVHGYCRRAGTQTPAVDFLRNGQIAPIVEELEFGDSETIVLPAGTYELRARFAGLLSGEFLTSPPTLFEANKIYIVLLEGVEDASAPHEPKFRFIEEPVRDP